MKAPTGVPEVDVLRPLAHATSAAIEAIQKNGPSSAEAGTALRALDLAIGAAKEFLGAHVTS